MLGPEARRCCNCDRSVADLLSHLVTREGRKEKAKATGMI